MTDHAPLDAAACDSTASGSGAAFSEERTRELVEAAREGDLASYEELFEKELGWLTLFVQARLGGGLRRKLEPEDVLQETFLEAHRTFERFEPRGKGSFARWLCRIAESMILRQAEWFGAEKRDPRREAAASSTLFASIRGDDASPSSLAARLERYERLAVALGELDPDERDVVLQRFFQGLSIPEIVERSGRSRSTLKRVLGRATLRLGVALGDLEA